MEERRPGSGAEDVIALNEGLIDELKKGEYIRSASTEAAFRAVHRHHFLPGTPFEDAYSNRAIRAKQDASGEWISSSSQPSIMAIMLEQLDLKPGQKVLEIGTGPGYNAALMAHIVGETGQVVTVEIDQDLTDAACEHLTAAGFEQVQAVCADGGYGYPDAAPYDRIILTVGAPAPREPQPSPLRALRDRVDVEVRGDHALGGGQFFPQQDSGNENDAQRPEKKPDDPFHLE